MPDYLDFDNPFPWVLGTLHDLDRRAVFQAPAQLGIVEQVHVQAVAAGAVEIARKRRKRALQVRRATGSVVPLIANLVVGGWIERQRIAITVQRAAQRHSRIDAVVESAF